MGNGARAAQKRERNAKDSKKEPNSQLKAVCCQSFSAFGGLICSWGMRFCETIGMSFRTQPAVISLCDGLDTSPRRLSWKRDGKVLAKNGLWLGALAREIITHLCLLCIKADFACSSRTKLPKLSSARHASKPSRVQPNDLLLRNTPRIVTPSSMKTAFRLGMPTCGGNRS